MFFFQKSFHHVPGVAVEVFRTRGWKTMGDDTRTDVGQINTEPFLFPTHFVGGDTTTTRLTKQIAFATEGAPQTAVTGFNATPLRPFAVGYVGVIVPCQCGLVFWKVEDGVFGCTGGHRELYRVGLH